MKKIGVLGITGSIGIQTLDVVLQHPDEFTIVAISAGSNMGLLTEILSKCSPDLVCVLNQKDAYMLKQKYPKIDFVFGDEGLIQIATYQPIELLINALVGYVGLRPTLAAITAKKDIALANKETLVVGGKFVIKAAKENNVNILPIDSEHSAIFQAIAGRHQGISKLIITASGGSLRDKSRSELVNVTKKEALAHPNWTMGAKITIDSATMMNKGLEVIEAHWLFDMEFDDIEVIMHPESVIHSMVEYVDGSVIAQLGTADMRLPIQYALSYPRRLELVADKLNLAAIGKLHFKQPDLKRYPLLELAYQVGRLQGNLPIIMNAANEEAVRLFLDDKISFLMIENLVLKACSEISYVNEITLDDITYYDRITREFVLKEV